MTRRNIRRAQNAVFDENLDYISVSRPTYYVADVHLWFDAGEETWRCDARLELYDDTVGGDVLFGDAANNNASIAVEDAIWYAFANRFPNGAEGVEIERYSQQEIDALVERAEDWYDENKKYLEASRRPIRASFKSHARKAR